MKNLLIIMMVLMMGILLVGCGGEESAEPAPIVLNVEANDMLRFTPDKLTAKSGAPVTVNFTNGGGLEHNFLIVEGENDGMSVTDADALPGTLIQTVSGGAKASARFIAPAPGTYTYVCTTAGHAASGMIGTLTVTE